MHNVQQAATRRQNPCAPRRSIVPASATVLQLASVQRSASLKAPTKLRTARTMSSSLQRLVWPPNVSRRKRCRSWGLTSDAPNMRGCPDMVLSGVHCRQAWCAKAQAAAIMDQFLALTTRKISMQYLAISDSHRLLLHHCPSPLHTCACPVHPYPGHSRTLPNDSGAPAASGGRQEWGERQVAGWGLVVRRGKHTATQSRPPLFACWHRPSTRMPPTGT